MAILQDDALTTLTDVKESLAIASSDHTKDNLITRKINQATEMIKRYTNRSFRASDYTEYVDAPNTDQLVLRNRPINSVTSIGRRNSIDNNDSFENLNSQDYFFTTGSLDAKAGVIDAAYYFGGGYDSYKIVYNAGYSTANWPTAIPADLQEACATLAAFLVENGTAGTNVKSKSEGQRRIDYFEVNQSQSRSLIEQLNLDDILAPYANTPIIEAS